MRKPWKGLLALLGIVLLAGAAFTVHIKLSSGNTEERTAQEESKAAEEAIQNASPLAAASFPLIYTSIDNRQVNVLHGYASERDLTGTELPLIPIDNGILSLNLSLYGNSIQSVSYEIGQACGEAAVASGEFSDWDNSSENVTMKTALPDSVSGEEIYFLTVRVELSSEKTVWYYARIRRGSALHASDMISYVNTFHLSSFDSDKAKEYSSQMESDDTVDSDTLVSVNLHSTMNQLSWGDLNPTEADGTRTITILELDGSFGSFLMNYEVTAGENSDRYLVSEYFTLRRDDTEIYLMDYSRTMTELFSGESSCFTEGNVDLGVVSEDDVSAVRSEDGNFTAFSVGGELWCSGKLTGELIRVFTFRDEDDLLRSGYTGYDVKPLKAEDDGSVSFLVYGYMNRGIHEGETGIAGLRYDHSSNTSEELFFIPVSGSEEVLETGIQTLAAMDGSGHVYVMAGDSVFDIDTQGQTVSVLADQIMERSLVVNADQTAVAWTDESAESGRKCVRILYLDTGAERTVEASENEWIEAEGFIDDDCILGIGHDGEQAEVSGEITRLFYAVEIQDREGTAEAHYEYDGIYISKVEVMDNQMDLYRVKANGSGGYRVIDTDTLIQNSGQDEEDGIEFTVQNDDARMNILILKDGAAGTDAAAIRMETTGISWDLSEAFEITAVLDSNTDICYNAYAEGRLLKTTETAGEAIALAYDSMGAVIDTEGRLIWYRTDHAETVDSVLSMALTGTTSESRDKCLAMMAQSVGGNTNTASLTAGLSTLDSLNQLTSGKALNLTGAPVKALLYYIDCGTCIMVTDSSNHSQLITAYDPWNVSWYDPVTGENTLMGQNDTQAFLDDGCTCLGVLP